MGSNERKYCEDGLETKIYLHRRSWWVLLVHYIMQIRKKLTNAVSSELEGFRRPK